VLIQGQVTLLSFHRQTAGSNLNIRPVAPLRFAFSSLVIVHAQHTGSFGRKVVQFIHRNILAETDISSWTVSFPLRSNARLIRINDNIFLSGVIMIDRTTTAGGDTIQQVVSGKSGMEPVLAAEIP
jgi:hypothetical protein